MKGRPETFSTPTFRTGTGTAAAVVFTLAAATGELHVCDSIHCSYNAVPSAGALTVAIGGITKFQVDIITSGVFVFNFPGGLYGEVGKEMVITLAAGDAGEVGRMNARTR